MAKLKAFVAKLEDVAEEFRDLYIEDKDKDGNPRFKLDAEGIEDVTGLKSTIATLRTENKTMKGRAKLLEDAESDDAAEEIVAAGRAAIEAKRTGKPIPEVESVKQQMARQHEKEVAKLKKRAETATETLRSEMITNRAIAEIADAKGSKKLLLPHLEREARVIEVEDGDEIKFEVRLFGDDKKELVDSSGNPVTIKQRVAQLREDPEFEGAFEGSGASGSGALPEGGSGTPTPTHSAGKGTKPAALVETKRRSQNYGSI